jgi:hypothetical protein
MSTEKLQRPLLQPKSTLQGTMPGLIASTLAIASLASPPLSHDIPTYVSNVGSVLISSFFEADRIKIDIQKLIFSIRTYSTFEVNWDGYNGKPPSNEAITDSINFLKRLPNNTAVPFSGLSGDGEISLFWDKSGVFIDIGFTGGNKYSYYARTSDGKEFFGNYISIPSNLPLDLVNILKTINS